MPPAGARSASPIQITWSRPGPTPTRRTGTPACSRDEVEVVARLARQVGLAAAVADVVVEARELLVLGVGRVEDRLVVRELVEHGSLAGAVADRDPQRVDPGEHVELGDRERR